MRKILILLGIFLIISGFVFAGGTQEKEEKVTIKVWGWTLNRSDGASIHPIAEAYMEENPNVEIEFMETNWNEAYNSIILMSQSGNMPDLLQVNRNWLQDFIQMGALEDLTSRVQAADFNAKFYEPVLGVDNGKTWVIPYLGGNSALIINRGLFDKMGLEVPKTMDDVVALGKQVSNPSREFLCNSFLYVREQRYRSECL